MRRASTSLSVPDLEGRFDELRPKLLDHSIRISTEGILHRGSPGAKADVRRETGCGGPVQGLGCDSRPSRTETVPRGGTLLHRPGQPLGAYRFFSLGGAGHAFGEAIEIEAF